MADLFIRYQRKLTTYPCVNLAAARSVYLRACDDIMKSGGDATRLPIGRVIGSPEAPTILLTPNGRMWLGFVGGKELTVEEPVIRVVATFEASDLGWRPGTYAGVVAHDGVAFRFYKADTDGEDVTGWRYRAGGMEILVVND